MTPIKYNFLINCTNTELKNYLNLKLEDAPKVFTRVDLNWCLQAYLNLSKRSNLQVECSNQLCTDAINLVSSDWFLQLNNTSENFVVCVRADFPKRRWAQFHIVQNKNQVFYNSSFLPHWVQPGLVKRDALRKGVFKVAYSGQIFNGNLAADEETWKKMFEPFGIEFETLTEGNWHDLASVDVLIAIRSFNTNPHNTKPPTKLFNAWHAHIPLVAGHDSAFKQVGAPGEDYLLVKTPAEAVNAVLLLRDDKNLYEKIVQNGLLKSKLYNEDTIAEAWESVLTGPVLRRYEQWLARPTFEKYKYKILSTTGMFEHNTKQIIKKLFLKKSK
jgi:hypothetical protein